MTDLFEKLEELLGIILCGHRMLSAPIPRQLHLLSPQTQTFRQSLEGRQRLAAIALLHTNVDVVLLRSNVSRSRVSLVREGVWVSADQPRAMPQSGWIMLTVCVKVLNNAHTTVEKNWGGES